MTKWLTDLLGWTDNGGDKPVPPVDRPLSPLPVNIQEINEYYGLILAAVTIWREARGQPREGQVGVWWVIRNRLAAGWSNNLASIITARNQFSCWNKDDVQVNRFPDPNDPAWLEVLGIIAGEDPDPTGGAKYYFNPQLANPSWALRMIKTISIGNHDFYRDP